jgi:hypothetical protein
MSWIQWRGQEWEHTTNDAKLSLHLWRPDAACPRQVWHLHLQHIVRPKEDPEGRCTPSSFLSVEIGNLHFAAEDWRRIEGLEIRADARWHASHEGTNEYGRAEEPVWVMVFQPGQGHHHWQGHDFTLRMGKREGLFLPCEIDVWALPKDEYHRELPETSEEVERFGEGPPTLRAMARAKFEGGVIDVPRLFGPGDPEERALAWARKALREATGCTDFHNAKVQWMSRPKPGTKAESEPMVGWTSRVSFVTTPLA